MNILSKQRLMMVGALLLMLLIPAGAAAYTVVLRSGQRVQIPDNFRVTEAGITYATAPRMEITIQMSVINVRATDQANREPSGALLARIGDEPEPTNPTPVGTAGIRRSGDAPRKTLTNADLEPFRKAREANEQAFDQQQTAKGSPTLAEIRRLRAENDAQMAERARHAAQTQGQSEGYWRQSAARLQDQIAGMNRQIAVARSQLQAIPVASLRVAQVDMNGLAIYSGPNLGTSPVIDTYLRSRLLRDLQWLQQQRATLQLQWNQLEEDARRAGAPNSWLWR